MKNQNYPWYFAIFIQILSFTTKITKKNVEKGYGFKNRSHPKEQRRKTQTLHTWQTQNQEPHTYNESFVTEELPQFYTIQLYEVLIQPITVT